MDYKQTLKSSLAILLLASTNLMAAPSVEKSVQLDNDHVLVVRASYPPGAESGQHTHSYHHRVLVTVKGGELRLESADPTVKPTLITLTDGQVLYLPATTHNVVNVGESEVVLVETEIK